MNLAELLENKIKRVTHPDWKSDTYLRIEYILDDEPTGFVIFVSPKTQIELGYPVGTQRLSLEEAFGTEDVWKKYDGLPYYGF